MKDPNRNGDALRDRERLVDVLVLDREELGFEGFAFCTSNGGDLPHVKFSRHIDDLKEKQAETFSLSIEAEPRLLAGTPHNQITHDAAVEWVKQNSEVLLQFWQDTTRLLTREIVAALRPIVIKKQ
jgi:hypothetical protein